MVGILVNDVLPFHFLSFISTDSPFLTNHTTSQMLVLYRRPQRDIPAAPATLGINKAAVKAARKKKISREVLSEPFSTWRAKQLGKMKSQAAFPTQVVW